MGAKLNLELKGISAEEMEKIQKYLSVRNMKIENFIEDSLKKYLITSEKTFEDAGVCPNCYLTRTSRNQQVL